MPAKFPDSLTEASKPANATILDGSENLEISPSSLKIIAPVTGPIPGIDVIGVYANLKMDPGYN